MIFNLSNLKTGRDGHLKFDKKKKRILYLQQSRVLAGIEYMDIK